MGSALFILCLSNQIGTDVILAIDVSPPVITLTIADIYGADTPDTEINSISINGKRPDHSPMAMVGRMNGCGLADEQLVLAICPAS